MATAKIKSTIGDFETKLDLPTGKPLKIKWSKDNNFVTEVPVEVNYKDDFGHAKVAVKNYAQDLINAYPHLELVEEVQPDPIVQPKVFKKRKKDEKESS